MYDRTQLARTWNDGVPRRRPLPMLCLALCLSATVACAQPLPADLESLSQEEAARLCVISMDAAARESLAKHRPTTNSERSTLGTLYVLETFWVNQLPSADPAVVSLRADLQRHTRLTADGKARLREFCEQTGLARLGQLPTAQEKSIVEQGFDRMRQVLSEEQSSAP